MNFEPWILGQWHRVMQSSDGKNQIELNLTLNGMESNRFLLQRIHPSLVGDLTYHSCYRVLFILSFYICGQTGKKYYTVSQKNDTDVAQYNFKTCPFAVTSLICCEITKAEMTHLSFQSCCILCLKNDTALACYIFDTHQPILTFVENKVVLLSTVCKYCFPPSHFCVTTLHSKAFAVRHNFRGSCFPR